MYPDQDIEDVMACFKELVDDGLIRYVGLSEALPRSYGEHTLSHQSVLFNKSGA